MIHDEWRHRAHAADDLLADIAAVCWGDMPAEAREGGSEAHRAAWIAVCALRVEVERLRGEVSYLRASVPPTHPSDYGHEAWSAALRDAEAQGWQGMRDAVEQERAAVVAWLSVNNCRCQDYAEDIKHGEHRREETK